ncbi:hypothetical protein DL96DRAFT_1676341 [Flagelloscypha sp. PMI_526]|nr:hypothetical protein DL96DRAFT_1676341 [Flagelloscypha sp. PMI_526]
MSASGVLSSPGNGLRFLSFDGGGIQAVSQAFMIREMMSCVGVDRQLSGSVRICDYFDIICGSGFGGLLAIMCGILKMTGDELVDEFVNLWKAVFSEGLDTTERTIVLEGEIKRLIGAYSGGGEERKMVSPDDVCKVFICAVPSQNTSHPLIFRNYPSPTDTNVDCMLWEAARATTILLGLFNAIAIGETSVEETTPGGDLRWNNSTEQLLKEAAHIFEGRTITSVVNIGSGHSGDLPLSEELTYLFPRIALDCERVADNMERRFCSAPEAFWRLSVEHDAVVDLWNLEALDSNIRSYLQGARTTRNIGALLQDLIQRPERISVDRASGLALAELDVLSQKLCPLPTQYFTGRRSELRKLDEYFTSGSDQCRVAVLYGTSGTGKTQTGLEFIRESQGRFTDVFFIDASDKFTLENDLKAIASGVSDNPTVNSALNLLRTKNTGWLLFLDNADDSSLDLRPYITWPHGNILITTRNNCNICVDKLELDDAKELLLRGVAVEKSSETDMIASEIVQVRPWYLVPPFLLTIIQELGCFALAVSQARGFLAQDICTLHEYLLIYIEHRRKLLEDGLIQTTDGYEHIAYTTWTISFNQLSSTATFFIELLCFMHCDGIPSRVFEDAWKELRPLEEEAVPATLVAFFSGFEAVDSTWDVLRYRRLITEVLSFSLINYNAKNRTFSLHPLVQRWVQSRCNQPQEMIRSTQTLLSLASPTSKSRENDAVVMLLLPHLRASAQSGLKVHYSLLHRLGHIYRIGGMFQECSAVHEQEMSEKQKQLGSKDLDITGSMNNLASAYSALGRHMDALNLREQVLALRTRILGEEHPNTLTSMEDVAATYSALGRHRDALKLREKVLAFSTQILGEQHPDTLKSMSILASTYSTLSLHKDALRLHRLALDLRVQILGKEHPDTLVSMGKLACTYEVLGKHRDALMLQDQALVFTTRILGNKHHHTLTNMNNLAAIYASLGRYKDALKLQEQVLAINIQILGEEHSATLTSMNNIAFMYSNLGQAKDALQFHEKVLALRTQTQGEEHPKTLTSMSNLANAYLALGQHTEAQNLGEKVVALAIQVLGEGHPDTLTIMSSLAGTYSALGQHMDARKFEEKVLAFRTQTLGEEHPDTLVSMGNLAGIYLELGQPRDALKLQEQALALSRQIMGGEHSDTLTHMSNLAYIYSDLGRQQEALKLHEQTLNMRRKFLGSEHPDTIDSLKWDKNRRNRMASQRNSENESTLDKFKRLLSFF